MAGPSRRALRRCAAHRASSTDTWLTEPATAELDELLRHRRRVRRVHALRVEPHRRGSQSGASALRRKPPQTDPLAQYFSSGTSFYEHAPGAYRMVKADKREKIVVVASEPLTFEKGASTGCCCKAEADQIVHAQLTGW